MKSAWRVIVGVVLVLFGGLALLQNFGLFSMQGDWWGVFFGLLFAAVGAAFLVNLFQDLNGNWWAAIPGFTLLGLGAMIVLAVLDFQPDELLATIFMGSIGLGFAVVYLTDRKRWWAIIPMGTLLSIAVMIAFAEDEVWPAVIFFGGLAATFAAVALLAPAGEHQRAWAWYPAGVMAALAVIIGLTAAPLPGVIFPIVLIAVGLILVAWTFLGKRSV